MGKGGGAREIHMASGNVPEIFLLQFYQISVSLFRNVFFPCRRSMIACGRKNLKFKILIAMAFFAAKARERFRRACHRDRRTSFT